MSLFSAIKKFFKPQYAPLICSPHDIFDLVEECIEIDAPICRLVIEHEGVKYQFGVTADYSSKLGFFDVMYYLDNDEYTDFDQFKREAKINGKYLLDLGTIAVIEDVDAGDPRSNKLLAQREIKY